MSPAGEPTTTVFGAVAGPADSATTRTGPSTPNCDPGTVIGPASAAGSLIGRQRGDQPVGAGRRGQHPALRVDHLHQRGSAGRHRVREPVAVDQLRHVLRGLPGGLVGRPLQAESQDDVSTTPPTTSPTARPSVASTTSRARRLQPRRRAGGSGGSCGGTGDVIAGQPPSGSSRYPAPRTVVTARRPNGASILRRR